MMTDATITNALRVLVRAREKVQRSPGVVKGVMSSATAEGQCFCLLGAVHFAVADLYGSNLVAGDDAEALALRELKITIGFDISLPLWTYNDDVLLKDLAQFEVSKEAKESVIAFFTQTIERLESSSC